MENSDNNSVERKKVERMGEHRNVFDLIGDFFLKMVKGVFIFVFWKLPKFLWDLVVNIKVFRYLVSMVRASFWASVWVLVVFGVSVVLCRDKFAQLWIALRDILPQHIKACIAWLLGFAHSYANMIWIVVALAGSCYGLIYVSVKSVRHIQIKRKMKKQITENHGPQGSAVSTDTPTFFDPDSPATA